MRDELVATHPRAPRAGARMTHLDHLPPEKIPGAFWTREGCQALAAEVGPATVHLVETLLADPVLDRLPRVTGCSSCASAWAHHGWKPRAPERSTSAT
jgi:hypothetical protein